MKPRPLIAVVEYNWTGHYIPYIKLYTRIYLELGFDVAVMCKKPDAIMEWIQLEIPNFRGNVHVDELLEPRLYGITSSTLLGLKRWFQIKDKLKLYEKASTLVFIPFLESFLLPSILAFLVRLTFPYKWFGILLQPKYLRIKEPLVYKLFNYWAIFKMPSCKAVLLLDEGVVGKLKNAVRRKNIYAIPDIADMGVSSTPSVLELEVLQKANGRRIVGLFNPKYKYKGILTMIKAAKIAKCENLFYLFCGEVPEKAYSPDEYALIREYVSSAPNSCFLYDKYITDEKEYNRVFMACDIIFASFSRFYHSSNTLTKAAWFKKPVIVSKNYCMASRVDKYRMGIPIQEENISECAEALNSLGLNYENYVKSADFEGYMSEHSEENLKSILEFAINA
jgi:glycosyltransferase involved in cell wall biosynthesis